MMSEYKLSKPKKLFEVNCNGDKEKFKIDLSKIYMISKLNSAFKINIYFIHITEVFSIYFDTRSERDTQYQLLSDAWEDYINFIS